MNSSFEDPSLVARYKNGDGRLDKLDEILLKHRSDALAISQGKSNGLDIGTSAEHAKAQINQSRLQDRKDINKAWRPLKAAIIANANKLDVPFSNTPEQSPWTVIKTRMANFEEALKTREEQ